MVVENSIIEKCLFIIFFNIENCNIDTYFKFLAPYLQAGEKNDKLTISFFCRSRLRTSRHTNIRLFEHVGMISPWRCESTKQHGIYIYSMVDIPDCKVSAYFHHMP